jgi:hypothetical protein
VQGIQENTVLELLYLQVTIQCALWDRFKELQNMPSFQVTNLAKFLAHLVIEKGLPLSVLKVSVKDVHSTYLIYQNTLTSEKTRVVSHAHLNKILCCSWLYSVDNIFMAGNTVVFNFASFISRSKKSIYSESTSPYTSTV